MSSQPLTRQRRKEARPGELLDAALALFVEKGFAHTTTGEVAARAGVSKGTLYLYFPSKEELLKAVIRHNLSLTISEGDDLASRFEGSTAELLGLIARGWWERVGETQASGIFKLMMTEVGNFPDLGRFYQAEVIEPGQRLVTNVLRRGIERGELRAGINVADAASSLIFPLLLLCLHKHSFGTVGVSCGAEDPYRFLGNHIDAMICGLAPRPPGKRPSSTATPKASSTASKGDSPLRTRRKLPP